MKNKKIIDIIANPISNLEYDKPITTYKQNNDVGYCNIDKLILIGLIIFIILLSL